MAESGNDQNLLTLTEVSSRTGISMPTLQRYKKLYQDRLPTVGEGRTQRYPLEALPIFEELKKENMRKRGRPRKTSQRAQASDAEAASETHATVDAAPGPAATQAAKGGGERLLTLKDVEAETSISYPTLLRYVKTSLKRIPHRGTGRKRRYLPEAIDVFKTLREESRRGRRGGAAKKATTKPASASAPRPAASGDLVAIERQLRDLQAAHRELQRHVKQLEKELRKPLKVTVQRS
ncbi:MAG: hypothetical protein AAGC60_01390 [Acidobacteriota bacterium]